MEDTDLAWNKFLSSDALSMHTLPAKVQEPAPSCDDLYISTKTKIAFLNWMIPLNNVFWNISIQPYQIPEEGVIKKQMKISCHCKEESLAVDAKIATHTMAIVDILAKVDNPHARRVKFKDVRKVSVGLCRKDLISHRAKKKGAFYNCFVLILRMKIDPLAKCSRFKEVHVKVFNTGKVEIPGARTDGLFTRSLDLLVRTLQPLTKDTLSYDPTAFKTVLINSNFSCGYFIDRVRLSNILKYDYGLHVIYDPCSYPGIQCKFYYNVDNPKSDGRCCCPQRCSKKGRGAGQNQCLEISFMVFRTGSVLIVGRCEESVLRKVYAFVSKTLFREYSSITMGLYQPKSKRNKGEERKPRKRFILVTKKPVYELVGTAPFH